jgi:integrase
MKPPKYRKHTTRNKGFAQHERKRYYFPGVFKSPESWAAYRAFLNEHGFAEYECEAEPAVYVADVGSEFILWANANYPPGCRSEAASCRAAIGHLIQFDGRRLVQEFGPRRLKALQVHLAGQVVKGKKKSRGYINAVCSRIKRAFKWAVSEELIPASIYHSIATVPGLRRGRTTAVEKPKRNPVDWAHVEAVLPELSPTVQAMVMLQWHTGARPQSICHARASQFDRTKKPWQWRPKHKMEHTGREVVLYVGPKAQRAIKSLFDGRDFLFQPKHQNGKRAKGFRSFYDPVSYLRAITRAIDRANKGRDDEIPYWTPHQLRHARGTAIRQKYGIEGVQAALAHSRVETSQIYAQRLQELAQRIAKETG